MRGYNELMNLDFVGAVFTSLTSVFGVYLYMILILTIVFGLYLKTESLLISSILFVLFLAFFSVMVDIKLIPILFAIAIFILGIAIYQIFLKK